MKTSRWRSLIRRLPGNVRQSPIFSVRELQQPIFKNGQLIYDQPTLPKSVSIASERSALFGEEVQRFENPHHYYVDLSWKLWHIKEDMLHNKKL